MKEWYAMFRKVARITVEDKPKRLEQLCTSVQTSCTELHRGSVGAPHIPWCIAPLRCVPAVA
jgi:hypothetical protein